MEIDIEVPNGVEIAAFFEQLSVAIDEQTPALFRSLGDVLVADVKKRIITSNTGTWAPASKWLRAKTGQSKVLLGAEKYVRASITRAALKIVGRSGKWTLTQHHEGFVNKLADPSERRDQHGRVVLKIKDPDAINLYRELRKTREGKVVPRASVFAFIPKKAGITPARQIWPTQDQADALTRPVFSRWLNGLVKQVGGALIR